MADEDQQDLDDEPGLEGGGAAGGDASLAGVQLAVAVGAGGEVDKHAGEALAAGTALADGGQQEGAGGNVQQAGEFLVGEAVFGFEQQALDGLGEGAVTGEARVAQGGEQAEAVETSGVAEGVEATVVIVAAEVGDLAEVAGGGAEGDLAKGMLELLHGDGGVGRQQRDQQIGGTGGHCVLVYHYFPQSDILRHL